MFCTQCGAEVKEGAAFCPTCGHKLTAPEVSSSANCDGEAAPGIPDADTVTGSSATKRSPLKTVAIVCVIVACIAVLAAGAVILTNEFKTQSTEIAPADLRQVSFTIKAPGMSAENSSQIPVSIEGTTLKGLAYSTTTYMNTDGSGIELAPGTYTVTVTSSPITDNGTVYEIPAAPLEITIPEDAAEGVTIQTTEDQAIDLVPRDPATVTEDEIKDIIANLNPDDPHKIDESAVIQQATDSKARLAAYNKILDVYQEAAESKDAGINDIKDPEGYVVPRHVTQLRQADTVQYSIFDINGDGVDELLISIKAQYVNDTVDNKDFKMISLFTFLDGKATSVEQWFDRQHGSLRTDGVILTYSSSGSNIGSLSVGRLNPHAAKLEYTEQLSWDRVGMSNTDTAYTLEKEDGSTSVVDASEIDRIRSQYPATELDYHWRPVTDRTPQPSTGD